MTSGNVSDEPIAYRDDDARERLAGIADHVLAHDRPIRTRTDDSVVRAVAGRRLMLRRSRGLVPDSAGAAGRRAARCWPAAPSSRARSAWPRATRAWVGPPHRRPAQRGDPALLRRRRRALRAALRGRAGGRRPRPAPRLPLDDLCARPRGRRARRQSSTTTPTSRRCWPSTASAGRRSGRSTTARATARRDGVGRRAAGRRPRRLRARRPPVARAHARRRPGRAPAVADGLRVAGRGAGGARPRRCPGSTHAPGMRWPSWHARGWPRR